MPKEYFSLERICRFSNLEKKSKIHIIGVAGVAMAPLAIALSKLGFEVTGSDKEFYEPMGSLLSRSSVRLLRGYKAENLADDVKLAVIGNTVSYDHPEVKAVEERRIPYTCFPELLGSVVIGDRHSIVVSGTHGKSTTTSLAASTLQSLGKDPSYFVGGLPVGFETGLSVGKGAISVVEGDEYDSAFFAKLPKFHFYKARTCIITSIEYDHADIYPDLDSIEKEFTKLVVSIPGTGAVIACLDCPNIKRLLPKWKESCSAQIITYGTSKDADYRITSSSQTGLVQKVTIEGRDLQELSYLLPLTGIHNAKNSLAVILALRDVGIWVQDSSLNFINFKGLKRRQEKRFDKDGLVIIDDFAHHPTAVKETILAIKSAYPNHKLISVFEPRSNTSRRKVFQADYVTAFKGSDQIILCDVEKREVDQGQELLDVQTLSNEIKKTGLNSVCLPTPEAIHDYIVEQCKESKEEIALLIMSNGGFGGLVGKLVGTVGKLK